MPKAPKILRTVPSLRAALAPCRKSGQSIALVPTMGALHHGHLALVNEAKRRGRRVVVSIFVNPTQFAPTEDFGSYPRTFKNDIAALSEAKVDFVWAPSPAVMYPGRFFHARRAGRPRARRARGQVPSAFLRRRRHRGRQTVHANTA